MRAHRLDPGEAAERGSGLLLTLWADAAITPMANGDVTRRKRRQTAQSCST
jgi:hypothetical protein